MAPSKRRRESEGGSNDTRQPDARTREHKQATASTSDDTPASASVPGPASTPAPTPLSPSRAVNTRSSVAGPSRPVVKSTVAAAQTRSRATKSMNGPRAHAVAASAVAAAAAGPASSAGPLAPTSAPTASTRRIVSAPVPGPSSKMARGCSDCAGRQADSQSCAMAMAMAVAAGGHPPHRSVSLGDAPRRAVLGELTLQQADRQAVGVALRKRNSLPRRTQPGELQVHVDVDQEERQPARTRSQRASRSSLTEVPTSMRAVRPRTSSSSSSSSTNGALRSSRSSMAATPRIEEQAESGGASSSSAVTTAGPAGPSRPRTSLRLGQGRRTTTTAPRTAAPSEAAAVHRAPAATATANEEMHRFPSLAPTSPSPSPSQSQSQASRVRTRSRLSTSRSTAAGEEPPSRNDAGDEIDSSTAASESAAAPEPATQRDSEPPSQAETQTPAQLRSRRHL